LITENRTGCRENNIWSRLHRPVLMLVVFSCITTAVAIKGNCHRLSEVSSNVPVI